MTQTNAAQVAHWNEVVGSIWVEMRDPMDRQLAPLGRAAMSALAPSPGETVLDIGCGSGQTTRELTLAVQPGGRVTGIDLSAPLLAAAICRAKGTEGVEFRQGDAQHFNFAPEVFDAAFSRFGVMFFDDPVAAFKNIRSVLKPGGRLAFVCWRAFDENPIFSLPLQAALPYLPALPPPANPEAPGPFAFADANRVRGILADAGFAEVETVPHDEMVGSGELETALDLALKFGSLGALLRENSSLRDAVAPAVRSALAAQERAGGIRLSAATWIVTARSPS